MGIGILPVTGDGYGLWENSVDLIQTIAEAGAANGLKIDRSISACVEIGMDRSFGTRCLRIELHSVCFHAHDRAGMRGEENVRNLGEHRIREVLYHELHAMRLGPAE